MPHSEDTLISIICLFTTFYILKLLKNNLCIINLSFVFVSDSITLLKGNSS